MLDFFPPKEILKLFCIVKTFTCFPGADICVLLINAVDLDAVIPDDVGTATVLIFVVGWESEGVLSWDGGTGLDADKVEGFVAGEGHMGKPWEQIEW